MEPKTASSSSTNPTTLNYDDLTLIIRPDKSPRNQVYDAAELYLPTIDMINPSTRTIQVSKTPRQKTIKLAIVNGEQVFDAFEDINLKWRYVVEETMRGIRRWFELTFDKKHKEKVITSYLSYVLTRAEAIKEEQKILKLRNVGSSTVDLEHPATFETIAMEPDLKRTIMKDLDRFLRRREFYKKVGKAWKRGYLLYGPPGTGKSSLIAAMANHLKFDVYELDLNRIYDDSQLKSVLLSTTNRSILVIEDIDCSVDMQNRKSEKQTCRNSCQTGITLSGLLNFMDGLWSSCGDERVIVFTTNHKDRLDPALLRPGRMDMHIHMSYCTPNAFKVLASNYLGINDLDHHRLYGEIADLLDSTNVTPAVICEELMKRDDDSDDADGDADVDPDVALEGLANFLKLKKLEGTTNETEIQEAKRPETGRISDDCESSSSDSD